MKKTVSAIIALLLTATTAAAVVLDGFADDKLFRANGTTLLPKGSASATDLYTGTQGNGVNVGFVTLFLIPAVNGASITDAEFSLTVTGNAMTDTTTDIYLEIYGALSMSASAGPIPCKA